jgi:putative membrane-bound dehydrogenase-like protein
VSLSPQESVARISVPDGFHVTLFAGEGDVRRPIAFDWDDRGRLWVVENYSHPDWRVERNQDRVLIFEDTDQDGQFDRRKVFWDGGRYLTGIAVGHGGVWLASTPELIFIPDRDRDDRPDTQPTAVLDGFQQSANNVLNNFHWGPDGWLYGAIGLSEPSLVGKPGTQPVERTQISRGMWRYHPRWERFEKLAEGMVNPWGADFNEFGDLFTTNTVIAHLWHIVPGMYCQRRDNERDHPYAYGRIQSIANHIHWGGNQWQSSRKSDEQHSVAGGGHAHCGAMIYLGDNWPPQYHGKFFTLNLHGRRINCDQLVPHRSTYVGVHDKDFLFSEDTWFRGLTLKYGPDGGVLVSDWHDFGECHDSDGSHRTSGRIYKVVFGTPDKLPFFDLQELTSRELAERHLHPNEWFVRHARRILQERAAAGEEVAAASQRLREIFAQDSDEGHKLRALWSRYVMGDLDEAELTGLLEHPSAHVRRWAVKLLVDREPPGAQAVAAMRAAALSDTSAAVRLALATALPRLSPPDRWSLATALVSHPEDATDPYLPLMVWYGIEPLVTTDPSAAVRLAFESRIPLTRQYLARRLSQDGGNRLDTVVEAAVATADPTARRDLLQGMLEALTETGPQRPPAAWERLFRRVGSAPDPALRSLAIRLATIFGDREAMDQLRRLVLDTQSAAEERRDALRVLLQASDSVAAAMLHELASEASILRRDAIAALTMHNNASTPAVLLDNYAGFDLRERQDAIGVLVTRRSFADQLLDAIEQGRVPREDVSVFALQQLRRFRDDRVQRRVARIWADDAQRLNKSDELAHYKTLLTEEFLASGDARAGREVFERSCARCHLLFGEGATIGPDLTGSGRANLDYVLSNLVDPSAVIDPAYRLTNVVTGDGRVYSGFVVHQGDKWLTLRTQEAQVRLAMDQIELLQTSEQSMMPDGMLGSFTDTQVRDLIVYLASGQQAPFAGPVAEPVAGPAAGQPSPAESLREH